MSQASNFVPADEWLRRLAEKDKAKTEITGSLLQSGGGGGNNGSMEARVIRLEEAFKGVGETLIRMDKRLDKIQDDIVDVKVSLARVEGELKSKVNWQGLVMATLAIVALPSLPAGISWAIKLLQ